jgi:ABC-2 type transport system ATP-binding protein
MDADMNTNPPALLVRSLEKSFGPVRALSGVDLVARRGEVTALLGPNGAGKTTTISCATGLLRPDAGSVEVLGQDPWHAGADLRARVGVMIQDGGLTSGASALGLLRYGAALYADPLDVDQVAEHLGITGFGSTLVRRLSGGQRQRLALALAIIGRPELVFLDEPTAGMDPSIRRTVRHLIRSLARTGTAVVLTTHMMDDVEGLADHVAVVADGRTVADGTVEEVVAAHRAPGDTVTLTATAHGLSPQAADALGHDLQEVAAGHGLTLDVRSGGAVDLESVLVDLARSDADHGPRRTTTPGARP